MNHLDIRGLESLLQLTGFGRESLPKHPRDHFITPLTQRSYKALLAQMWKVISCLENCLSLFYPYRANYLQFH